MPCVLDTLVHTVTFKGQANQSPFNEARITNWTTHNAKIFQGGHESWPLATVFHSHLFGALHGQCSCPCASFSPICCGSKVSKCYPITFLKQTPKFDQCVVQWGSKNTHHKDTCLKESKPCLNYSTLNIEHNRKDMCIQLRNPQTCTSQNHK